MILQYPVDRAPVDSAPSLTLSPAMAAIVLTDLAFVQSFVERNNMPASKQRDDLVSFLRRNLEPHPPPRRPATSPVFASTDERTRRA